MEGLAFLDKTLFTSFQYNGPTAEDLENDETLEGQPTFQISLPALLETLQIFGITEEKQAGRQPWNRDPYSSSNAFDSRVLGMSGKCSLSYSEAGAPLRVIIEEAGVTTTCSLVTYEPDYYNDIPFARDKLTLKVIMRASLLHDAVAELAATSPEHLILTASETAPHFTLAASGPLGSAVVEFSKDKGLLETFQVATTRAKLVQHYKFSLIKASGKAMAQAAKVSVRVDDQGVLSLQFMIEVDGGNGVSFVDFRFVPLVADEEAGNDVDVNGRVANVAGDETTDEE